MLYSILLLLFCGYSSGSSFLRDPKSITTTLGVNVTFICEYDEDEYGEDISWTFNGKNAKNVIIDVCDNDAITDLIGERGIYCASEGSQSMLTVTTTILNNGSSYDCRVFVGFQTFFSNTAHLTIIGPPLSPGISTDVKNNTITYMWQAPFTWEDNSILQYVVTIKDASRPRKFSIPARTQNVSYNYNIIEEVRQSCHPVEVGVIAVSDAGWSDASLSVVSLPRVPDTFGNVITSVNNTLGELIVSVRPPELCGYQLGNLSLMIQTTNSTNIAHVYQTYSGSPEAITFHLAREVFLEAQDAAQYSILFTLGDNEADVNATAVIDGVLLDTLLQVQTTTSDKAPSYPEDSVVITLKDGIIIGLCCLSGILFVLLIISVILTALAVMKTRKINGSGYKEKDGII